MNDEKNVTQAEAKEKSKELREELHAIGTEKVIAYCLITKGKRGDVGLPKEDILTILGLSEDEQQTIAAFITFGYKRMKEERATAITMACDVAMLTEDAVMAAAIAETAAAIVEDDRLHEQYDASSMLSNTRIGIMQAQDMLANVKTYPLQTEPDGGTID
jgi:hypothetical protein